jgi:sugar phosphate isomerase/epimerase
MMPERRSSRREFIAAAAYGSASGALAAAASEDNPVANAPFGYCLNTATIMGQKLGIAEEIDIAARAGYQGIEPWIRELDQFVKDGHSLKDLRKRLSDSGISVESAIDFAEWIVDDPVQRQKGMENVKRAMDMLQQIGGKRLAAPPAGAREQTTLDLRQAAARYRALLELGERMGVVPELEFWGLSKSLYRLGQAVMVAMDANHPRACVLADVFHLYKGGSDFQGLSLLRGQAIGIFHMNDYPAEPSRELINDAARVYPGDGVAPLGALFRELRAIGYTGMLSLEVFNRTYWQQDAFQVAKTGLEKMRLAVQKALA